MHNINNYIGDNEFQKVHIIDDLSNSEMFHKELMGRIIALESARRHEVISRYEVTNYNPHNPNDGWILSVYDKDGTPFIRFKCFAEDK